MTSEREVYVYVQLPGSLTVVTAAVLRLRRTTDGQTVGRFRYGDRYLARPDAVALDPFQLPLVGKVLEFTRSNGIPGAVRDSAPDAWGRRVIEHFLQRPAADLHEADYLLQGPQDGAGYLSFGLNAQPPAPRRRFNRTHQLSELVAVAQAIDDGRPVPATLLESLDPGTSLGGARPKATVEDGDALWLAKFPARADRYNLQQLEFATLELARVAGLNVATARLQSIGRSDVLMVRRFDRDAVDGGYLRYGLVSGLTVLDCEDSFMERDRWSYPLLADRLRRWSEKPDEDRVELFRRMVFNAAVGNTDDHPRNHALLRRNRGWRLSPAYDLVPAPTISLERRDLAMTVGDHGRTASRYNLLSQAGRFGLGRDEATAIIERTIEVVGHWRNFFASRGVSPTVITTVESAFLPASFLAAEPPQ